MLAFLLPLCLAPTATPQQPPAPVSEVFSLQHLVGLSPGQPVPPWRSLLRRSENHCDLLLAGDAVDGFTTEEAIDLLRNLEAQACENGQLQLTSVGDSLLAAGEQTVMTRVREHLKAATSLLARSLQVELAVWDVTDRETPAAFLGPSEYTKFTNGHAPLWRSIATTRHGRAVALERVRWSRYIRDIDVEVAQKQVMTRPVTDQYAEGGLAVVRPHLLTGTDDVAVHVQFAIGQRRGIVRTLQTGMAGAADIELPLLETNYGVCSGRVPNGGALAATLRGNAATGGQIVLTVRVTGRTPPAGAPMQDVGVYPCGAITTEALLQSVTPPAEGGDDDTQVTDGNPGFGHLPADTFVDFVRAGLGAAGEADGVSLQCKAGYLIARGPASVQTQVEALVRGLQDRLIRNATVVHKAPMTTTDANGNPGTSMLHELSLPALVGRELVVARCLETNVVADILVQIAQEAGTLDPGIELLQSGCWLRARLSPLGDSMYAQLLVQDLYAPPPQARSLMPGGGVMMPAEVGRSVVRHAGIVGNAQVIEHGDGPAVNLEGRAWRTSSATTIQW